MSAYHSVDVNFFFSSDTDNVNVRVSRGDDYVSIKINDADITFFGTGSKKAMMRAVKEVAKKLNEVLEQEEKYSDSEISS